MLARVTRGFNLALDTALAESAWNQNAIHVLELRGNAVLQRFRVHKFQFNSAIFARGGVSERLINTFVGVLKMDVFADNRNLDPLLRPDHAINKFFPTR